MGETKDGEGVGERGLGAADGSAGEAVEGSEEIERGSRRVALVIGNGDYASLRKLDNPAGDARRLARLLEANGFEVIRRGQDGPGCVDLRRGDFQEALEDLRARAHDAALAFVFFAGHGFESEREGNILAPVNMSMRKVGDVQVKRGDLSGAQARSG